MPARILRITRSQISGWSPTVVVSAFSSEKFAVLDFVVMAANAVLVEQGLRWLGRRRLGRRAWRALLEAGQRGGGHQPGQ